MSNSTSPNFEKVRYLFFSFCLVFSPFLAFFFEIAYQRKFWRSRGRRGSDRPLEKDGKKESVQTVVYSLFLFSFLFLELQNLQLCEMFHNNRVLISQHIAGGSAKKSSFKNACSQSEDNTFFWRSKVRAGFFCFRFLQPPIRVAEGGWIRFHCVSALSVLIFFLHRNRHKTTKHWFTTFFIIEFTLIYGKEKGSGACQIYIFPLLLWEIRSGIGFWFPFSLFVLSYKYFNSFSVQQFPRHREDKKGLNFLLFRLYSTEVCVTWSFL